MVYNLGKFLASSLANGKKKEKNKKQKDFPTGNRTPVTRAYRMTSGYLHHWTIENHLI
jgi:hypothetical protein